MFNSRRQISDWYAESKIPRENIAKALSIAGVTPDKRDWQIFITRFLLWAGVSAIAVSFLFLIAYNWQDMARLTRFAVAQTALVISFLLYWRFQHLPTVSDCLLFLTSLVLGGLLALMGQTYQTGADSWQLFLLWASLLLPWVYTAQSNPLSLLTLSLLNLSLYLWLGVNDGFHWQWWPSQYSFFIWAFLLNTLALFVWESMLKKNTQHPTSAETHRWPLRLIGVAITLTVLGLGTLMITSEKVVFVPLSITVTWVVGSYLYYKYRQQDLYFLTLLALLLILLSGIGLIDWFFNGTTVSLLVSTVYMIAVSTLATAWLKRVNREFNS
ncbi:DUF2157 domain-containing protein [Veronia pacifica]|uniref:DUF2157 domain-containing protein n=1 Tax=Veronia pacifica TaxID=1080227 RepID=A0A1C3ERM3_9GAMM|nr:DUF2157 domain-containing protein [Veronia pacifica]ODA35880.1 hypothetical protein A8L45_02270 [Veronia pacifica]